MSTGTTDPINNWKPNTYAQAGMAIETAIKAANAELWAGYKTIRIEIGRDNSLKSHLGTYFTRVTPVVEVNGKSTEYVKPENIMCVVDVDADELRVEGYDSSELQGRVFDGLMWNQDYSLPHSLYALVQLEPKNETDLELNMANAIDAAYTLKYLSGDDSHDVLIGVDDKGMLTLTVAMEDSDRAARADYEPMLLHDSIAIPSNKDLLPSFDDLMTWYEVRVAALDLAIADNGTALTVNS